MDDQDKLDESRARYIDNLLHDLIPEMANLEGPSTDTVKGFIGQSVTNLEERLKTYLASIPKDDEEGLRRCMQGAESQEHFLMQIFTHRKQQGYRTGGPNIFILQDFLTKTMPEFLNDVNLDGTQIMDQLIQDEVMSDDERNSIIQESTPRRRKESFIGLMRSKLTWKSLKENYIPAIEVDHPKVATEMRKTYTDITENPPPSSQCTVCSVKDAVPAQNLAQRLLENKVITSGFYEELRSRNKSNSEKWTRLCEHISDHSSIIDALETPFPQFYNLLEQNDVTEMKCFCQNEEDDSSLISNANMYFDAGNNLLGDLDSVIGAETRKDANGNGANQQNQFLSSRMQSAHITLNLDPTGPDYTLLIKPARPFPMNPTAASGPTTFKPRAQGFRFPTSSNVLPGQWSFPPPPLPQVLTSTVPSYPSKPPPQNVTLKMRAGRPVVKTNSQPASIKEEEHLTASMLASANPQEQKQMLGERLFPIIEAMDAEQTGKITGMLLELDNSEILDMLDSPEVLKEKVDEAKAVLHLHKEKETTKENE